MENKKGVKLRDFEKKEENGFMKEGIEGIENDVVKKYKSNSGGDKRGVVGLGESESGEVFKSWFMGEIEVDEEELSKLYVCKFGGLFEV